MYPNTPTSAVTPAALAAADVDMLAAALRPDPIPLVPVNRMQVVPIGPWGEALLLGERDVAPGDAIDLLITGGRTSLLLLRLATRLPRPLRRLADALTWLADAHPSRREGEVPAAVVLERHSRTITRVALVA